MLRAIGGSPVGIIYPAPRRPSLGWPSPQPRLQPPGPGGLHLPDRSVQTLDLGVGAAEMGGLVVDHGPQLCFVVIEALSLAAQLAVLVAQGGKLTVQSVVKLLQTKALGSHRLVLVGEGRMALFERDEVRLT